MQVINLNAKESNCAVCGIALIDCQQGIPFYEGKPVSLNWIGDWIGKDVCLPCYDKYMKSQDEN